MTKKTYDLNDAYQLKTPEDSVRVYGEWARTYDLDFAETMDYRMPKSVAQLFQEKEGGGPILDVGAGTGLLGSEIAALGLGPVDGIDISGPMLEVARERRVYDHLFVADVLAPIADAPRQYDGFASSGTFTTGHVGPEAIDQLLPLANPNALFVLAVNKRFFGPGKFDQKLETLQNSGRIKDLSCPERAYYGPGGQGEHRDDIGVVVCFRTA